MVSGRRRPGKEIFRQRKYRANLKFQRFWNGRKRLESCDRRALAFFALSI